MQAYQALADIFAKRAHLLQLGAVADWDEAVMMPTGGGETRAQDIAVLTTMVHEMLCQPQIPALLAAAKVEAQDTLWEKANVKWMESAYIAATAVPSHLINKSKQAFLCCEQAWRTYRRENNWQAVMPLLQNSISYRIEMATLLGEAKKMSPYDALIDTYSPGMTQQIIDPIFDKLKNFLPNFIQKVMDKQSQQSIIPLAGGYATDQQKRVGIKIMQAMGFDSHHGRLDVSDHPFCGGTPRDVRITTRYTEEEFLSALMGICHETGHGLYEQGLPEQWLYQPVGCGLGMAVHESQSLLMEMQVCRSQAYMSFLSQQLQAAFVPEAAFSPENLYKISTRCSPGLIRIDADEVTYPLHIILRYELEKQLVEGRLAVADLPDAWNAYMLEFFGLNPEGNHRDGVMQDVHWYAGDLGYFPAYTLGALIAAQLFSKIKQVVSDLDQRLAGGDFSPIVGWLRDNIHRKASLYTQDELLAQATGEQLNPDKFILHLQQRYG